MTHLSRAIRLLLGATFNHLAQVGFLALVTATAPSAWRGLRRA